MSKVIADIGRSHGDCIVGIGNSVMAYAFVPEVFNDVARNLGLSCAGLNASMGGADVVEQLLLMREALRSNPHPKMIVYGFFDLQLSEKPTNAIQDLVSVRNVGLVLEPQLASRYYEMPLGPRIELSILRHFPIFVFRGHAYKMVTELRERLQRIGLPPEEQRPKDRFVELLLPPSVFTKTLETYGTVQPIFSRPVRELLNQAKQTGARVVLVSMPLPPSHITTYYSTPEWASYKERVQHALSQEGIEFLDGSQWEPDARDYLDSVHLNEEGSKQFTSHLAQCLLAGCP